jgi:predicted nucleotidyltransferase
MTVGQRRVSRQSWWERSAQGKALRKHRAQVVKLVASYNGTDIMVVGSVARGEATPDSDIDLLVDIPDRYFELELVYELSAKLEQLLGFDVDVVSKRILTAGAERNMRRDARAL